MMNEQEIELVKRVADYAISSHDQIIDILQICQEYLDYVAREQNRIRIKANQMREMSDE